MKDCNKKENKKRGKESASVHYDGAVLPIQATVLYPLQQSASQKLGKQEGGIAKETDAL
jgi:hypothetical protein